MVTNSTVARTFAIAPLARSIAAPSPIAACPRPAITSFPSGPSHPQPLRFHHQCRPHSLARAIHLASLRLYCSSMPSIAQIPQPVTMVPPAKRPRYDHTDHTASADHQMLLEPPTAPASEGHAIEHIEPTAQAASAALDDGPLPTCTSPLQYENGIFLGPMVRIGTLPTRLLSLEYGADLVWGPEIVDRGIIGTERKVDPATGVIEYHKDGKQAFSCHPIERPYLVFQVGSSNPDLAAQAVKIVTEHDDVAAVDLNCGCPKPFSTHAGMGANLLSTPDLLCNILRAMRRAAPPHVAVTCKIRLLPTQEATIALVDQIVKTGAIECLTVHCRTKDMRPREPALLDRLREVVDHVDATAKAMGRKIPVVCNGDCWDASVAPRIKELTGVTSTMIARGAEANPSCFRSEGSLSIPDTIAPKYVQYSLAFNNPLGNSKYCLGQLAFKPSESIPKEVQAQGIAKLMSKKQLSVIRTGISQAKTLEDLAEVFKIDPDFVRSQDVENVILKDLKDALSKRARTAASGLDGERVGAVVGSANQSTGSLGDQPAHGGNASGDDQSRATDNSPQPEWKQQLAENISKHIKEEKSLLYYALSTVEMPTSVHDAAKPHVRYVVHRGFVNEKRDGDASGGIAPQNPKFGSSPCLMTTTDVRTPKVQQLISQSGIRAQGTDGSHGGEGEIAWWIESAQLQFRISGTIHVLPTQGHPLRSLFPFDRLSPPRAPGVDSSEAFDWDGERTRIFNKLSPGLLASFCRPVPGSPHPNASALHSAKPKDDTSSPWPLQLPQPGKEETEQQKEWLRQSEQNFALVVIEPRSVDLVNLANDERTIYELKAGHTAATGEWTKRRIVP
ncbi:tRNA-dihydrouridine synthase 2 [Thecaphora frezii]